MNWYETTGQAHLRHFFGLINQTIRQGKDNGLQVQRIDVGDALKIYRGEKLIKDKSERAIKSNFTLDTIHEIQHLYKQGISQNELAERFGISRSYVANLLDKKPRRRVI